MLGFFALVVIMLGLGALMVVEGWCVCESVLKC